METSKEMGGMGGVMGILFIILIIWIIFGGGIGGFGRGVVAAEVAGGCNRVSNCELEKETLVANYNGYLTTINQGISTRDTVLATANATQTKIDFYAYQNLRDQLMDNKFAILAKDQTIERLQGEMTSRAEFCAIKNQLNTIQANALQRPPFYPYGCSPCTNGGCGALV